MQEKAKQFSEQGFAILPAQLSSAEISRLNSILDSYRQSAEPSCSNNEIFAVRNLLQTIPELAEVLNTSIVPQLAKVFAGNQPSSIRSIYFNKPATANWVVPWHQDLTVNLKEQSNTKGFSKWAVKDGQLTAKAPPELFSNILTLRIHLDDCDENNGALKVIPGSHLHGELRTDDYLKTELSRAVTCPVNSGGIMLMRPLLLHASARSKGAERRVIHLEFYSGALPAPLQWSEAIQR